MIPTRRADAGGLLGWPQGTFAHKIELSDAANQRRARIDGGLQTVELKLPAVRDDGSAPQRAALCLASQYHEGEEEADRGKTPADYHVDATPRLKVH